MQGGALAAKVLGTTVLENKEGTLTANMVNVELPLKTEQPPEKVRKYFLHTLVYVYHTMATIYPMGGKWYARLSAQTYIDLEDFKQAAEALKKACQSFKNRQKADSGILPSLLESKM